MARLNQKRQTALEPERLEHAVKALAKKGITAIVQNDTTITFMHKSKIVYFYPYSGWATGSTINDGRGLENLLKQL